jgi:hypothetical protein
MDDRDPVFGGPGGQRALFVEDADGGVVAKPPLLAGQLKKHRFSAAPVKDVLNMKYFHSPLRVGRRMETISDHPWGLHFIVPGHEADVLRRRCGNAAAAGSGQCIARSHGFEDRAGRSLLGRTLPGRASGCRLLSGRTLLRRSSAGSVWSPLIPSTSASSCRRTFRSSTIFLAKWSEESTSRGKSAASSERGWLWHPRQSEKRLLSGEILRSVLQSTVW